MTSGHRGYPTGSWQCREKRALKVIAFGTECSVINWRKINIERACWLVFFYPGKSTQCCVWNKVNSVCNRVETGVNLIIQRQLNYFKLLLIIYVNNCY